MAWMNVIVIVHVLLALAIIGLVLLQHGKGADMGSGFGGGSSSSLFGATGSANFLSRATAALATLFFLLSLGLAYLATSQPRESGSVLDRVRPVEKKAQVPESAPGAQPEAQKSEGAGKAPAGAPGKEVPQ